MALAVAVLVIALAAVLWGKFSKEEKYAAVTLNPGIIYFGKFSRFPSPILNDVWMLNKDAEGRPTLEPLKNAPWSPDGALHLNRKQIISWSYLKDDSQIVQTIRSSSLREPGMGAPNSGGPMSGQGGQGPFPGGRTATSTPPFQGLPR